MYKYELSYIIEDFIFNNHELIDYYAKKFSLNNTTVEIQIRLHIAFYDVDELQINNNIVNKLTKYFKFYNFFNNKLNNQYKFILNSKLKGKNEIYLETKNKENIRLHFRQINDTTVDRVFQKKLHYIKKYRKDTFDSFGLFLNVNDRYPICYASISKCDRLYLLNALKKVDIISNDFEKDILILTRAFSIENAPKNLMSKLFDKIYNFYKNNNTNSAIILTALNPVLGFKGSVFKGSSYFQFAKSPMAYNYDNNGIYLNRRAGINQKVYKQKIEIPPIIWLARGLNKKFQKRIENNNLIYNILSSEYDAE